MAKRLLFLLFSLHRKMITDFFITGSSRKRPVASGIVFCDGSADSSYRPAIDIELSHWVPNRTPIAYRADTSTEICMRFVEHRPVGKWTHAVNSHIDVDGILSVFVILHPGLALQHREAIVAAAEMGDFWGWGDQPAQVLFQGLTRLIDEFGLDKTDPYDVYSECLRRVPGLLEGHDPLCKTALLDLQPLRDSVALIDSAAVGRSAAGDRFVHYTIPASVARGRLSQALYVPKFNEAISPACLMWPQARNRQDAQRIQLVSVETDDGWHHALWYPGYLWADTENLWRPLGISFTGGMERYQLNLPPLQEAVIEFQKREQDGRRWRFCDVLQPFHETAGADFPVVLRLVNEQGQPVPSGLSPDTMMSIVGPVFRTPTSSRRSKSFRKGRLPNPPKLHTS